MAALPILPGLMASDDEPDAMSPEPGEAPSAIAQFLDGLDDSQIQELTAAADDWAQANPEPDAAPAPDGEDAPDAADAPDSPADEAAESPEDEAAESPEKQDAEAEAGTEDLSGIQTQVEVDVEESAQLLNSMQELADGDGDSAGDVAKLVKQATALDEKIQKCAKLVEKAVAKEDAKAAAQAGMDASDYLESIQHIAKAAQSMGQKSVAPDMKATDHPAIKMWAAKIQGRKAGAPPAPAKPAFGGK